MSVASWRPVLDGPEADRAWRVIDHVARALRRPPPPYDGHIDDELLRASLFAREPGFAVFYDYLARARGDDELHEIAARYLEQGLDLVSAIATTRPQLSYGFAGTGWALAHLAPDDDESELDDALTAVVEATRADAPFMLNTGFVGYGVYALERMPAPSARRLLQAVCAKLVAGQDSDGAWRIRGQWMVGETGPEDTPPDQRHTGIRSGTAGPVAVLQAAARWGQGDLASTIETGLDWIARQRGEGRLPAVRGGRPLAGYANGDAATAAALVANGLDTRALAIAEAALGAIPDATSVSLEGGASGTALALLRLASATGDARFAASARAWIAAILDTYDPSIGLGGYRFHVADWESRYLSAIPSGDRELPGISFGVAGVALVLLAAVTPIAPAWDRMFLLSARDPEIAR